jgi:hypothetical protein
MATGGPYHEPGSSDERAVESYFSPTVDFLLLFGLATVVAMLAASVLFP